MSQERSRPGTGERDRYQAEKLSPSIDLAWFLGALVRTGGNVDRYRRAISFTSEASDENALLAFKAYGEMLLSTAERKVYGQDEILPSGNRRIVFFDVMPFIKQLGDFRKAKVADTIRERFPWVRNTPYNTNFVSGVFNSQKVIILNDTIRKIVFSAYQESRAELYQDMLTWIGIKARFERKKNKNTRRTTYSVVIETISDLRTFARKISSADPEKQRQLDVLKELTKQKRTLSFPSPEEIFTEFDRLYSQYGDSLSSSVITSLKRRGETTIAIKRYVNYFGFDSETGKNRFTKALERLREIRHMSDKERQEALQKIITTSRIKNTAEQIRAEWHRLRPLLGSTPTATSWRKLYSQGETSVHLNQIIRTFGSRDGAPPKFSVAREVLENKTNSLI